MATNYIELVVRARDEAAPELDELRAKLDELGAKVENAKVDVDDKDGVAKLARMNARLADLNRRVANPKISVSGAARAEADLAAVDLSLDHIGDKGTEDTGILNGLSSAISGAMENIPLVGGLLSKLADTGPAGAAAAVASIATAIGAALTEVGALVTGLAAAVLGIGSLAALALPTFTKIFGAIGDSRKQLDKLPAPIREAVDGVKSLEKGFMRMSKALQPAVLKIFSTGLGIAAKLMPYLGKFAQAAAPAVEGIMKSLSREVSSKGFSDLMNHLLKITPGAITAIGNGLIELGKDFGKLMMMFSKKDAITAINIAFGALHFAIKAVMDIIWATMTTWDTLTGAWHAGVKIADDVTRAVKELRTWLGHLATDGAHDAERFYDAIAARVSAVIHWFRELPGRIKTALSDLPGMMEKIGEAIIRGLISGAGDLVGWAEGKLEGWGHDIANALGSPFGVHFSEPSQATKMVAAGRNIAMGLGTGMDSATGSVHAAANRLAAAAGLSGHGGMAGAGTGQLQLEVKFTGSNSDLMRALWPLLRAEVRVKGGGGLYSVQKALGQRAPAGA